MVCCNEHSRMIWKVDHRIQTLQNDKLKLVPSFPKLLKGTKHLQFCVLGLLPSQLQHFLDTINRHKRKNVGNSWEKKKTWPLTKFEEKGKCQTFGFITVINLKELKAATTLKWNRCVALFQIPSQHAWSCIDCSMHITARYHPWPSSASVAQHQPWPCEWAVHLCCLQCIMATPAKWELATLHSTAVWAISQEC